MIHGDEAFLRVALNLIAYSVLGSTAHAMVCILWSIEGVKSPPVAFGVDELIGKHY